MEKVIYNLGKRDALAEVFMMIRKNEGDFKKTFIDLVNQYEIVDKENPHCAWLKEFLTNLQ